MLWIELKQQCMSRDNFSRHYPILDLKTTFQSSVEFLQKLVSHCVYSHFLKPKLYSQICKCTRDSRGHASVTETQPVCSFKSTTAKCILRAGCTNARKRNCFSNEYLGLECVCECVCVYPSKGIFLSDSLCCLWDKTHRRAHTHTQNAHIA